MKIPMNLTIDLGDSLIECDECGSGYNISEAIRLELKSSIQNDVMSKISKEIIEKIREDIKDHVVNQIKPYVLGLMETELKNLKIKEYGAIVDAETYIRTKIENEIKSNDIGRSVRTIAENYTKTIKERYDVVFASTLIDKMLKANLLKDDRVASLLSEPVKE